MILVDKSYVVASIMNTRKRHGEDCFASKDEVNIITDYLKKKFDSRGIDVSFEDKINKEYFKSYNGVYLLNNDIIFKSVRARYTSYAPYEVIITIWNDKSIYEQLSDIKNASNSKRMSKDNFYKKIARALSKEEREYIKNLVDKDCFNCINSCKDDKACDNWKNDSLVGRIKVLNK